MENIPNKFINNDGALNTDLLLNSYLELEKKLARMMPKPEDDESKRNIFKTLGMPDSSDDYNIDTSHGMFEVDSEMNSRLHDMGFTSAQVQAVYDLAAEKLVPIIMDMSVEFQADREVEKLISYFGGEEQWQEVSTQISSYARSNLSEELYENLSSSYDGVLALFKMMKSEAPDLNENVEKPSLIDEKEIQSMMRDPKYWKTKDSSHIAKVSSAFEKLYGEK